MNSYADWPAHNRRQAIKAAEEEYRRWRDRLAHEIGVATALQEYEGDHSISWANRGRTYTEQAAQRRRIAALTRKVDAAEAELKKVRAR